MPPAVRIGVIAPAPEAPQLATYLSRLHQSVQPNSKEEYLLPYPGFAQTFGVPLDLPQRGHDGWIARTLKRWLARSLPHALDRPWLVIGASLLLVAAAAAALTRVGTTFLPEFHEGSLTVQANTQTSAGAR